MHGIGTARQAAAVPEFIRLLRPRQWIKNAFVSAPLFFTPAAVSPGNFRLILAGTVIFCLASSAIYILNDLFDREADRLHPTKAARPLAAGTVSVGTAVIAFSALTLTSIIASLLLSKSFGLFVISYLVLQSAYSLGLKHIAVLDAMMIAIGFVLRIFAGSALIGAVPSPWIVIATGLVASFLALAKRRDDLSREVAGGHRRSLSGYTVEFLDTATAILLSALLVCYLMYTTSDAVIGRLNAPHLYMTSLFVLAGVLRYLQLAIVFRRSGSPTDVMLSDPFMITACAGWFLVFGYLVHG